MSSAPNPVKAPPHVHTLLSRLHAISLAQEAALPADYLSLPSPTFDTLMRDKYIALTPEKCQFVYQLARASNATSIVEVGSSMGVSTIYLALAANANADASGSATEPQATVIATELEPSKASQAQVHFHEAGDAVAQRIDLRIGDLRETLAANLPDVVDFVLLDIWAPMALPALKLVEGKLRRGGIVVIDNSVASQKRYKDLFEYLRGGDGWACLTVPYGNGLDVCLKS